MAAFLFGAMGIASLFSVIAFGNLAWRRRALVAWGGDAYFWLSAGIAIVCLGLLEFAVLRTYQSIVSAEPVYVQQPAAALSAVSVICCGLACFIRAKSLARPEIGRLFLYSVTGWLALCIVIGALR